MKNVLIINSSINHEGGNSAALTQHFIGQLGDNGVKTVTRNLDATLSHLSAEEMQAWMTPVEERSAAQQQLAVISDEIVAEVQAADVIVIGMPMYNFGVPSAFKAWVDRLARAGITFKYTENGPVGLLSDKQVVVLAARGGRYSGTPKDTQTTYLRDFFAFLGLTDIDFIYAEGLAMGDEPRAAAMAAAQGQIREKVAALSTAATASAA